MKIHLIDVQTEYEEVDVGTCEFCFGTYETFKYPTFIFKLANGKEITVNGWWDSWDNVTVPPINNLVHFAEWLDTKVYRNDTKFDTDWLESTIMEYFRVCGDLGIKDREGNPIYADSIVLVTYRGKTVRADDCYIDLDNYANSHVKFTMFDREFDYQPDDKALYYTDETYNLHVYEDFDSSNLLVLAEHFDTENREKKWLEEYGR